MSMRNTVCHRHQESKLQETAGRLFTVFNRMPYTVGPSEALSKVFLLFFLFSDWVKLNHLRSRIERGFFDISRHICSAVTETILVTNYATSFGAKKCSENQVRSC